MENSLSWRGIDIEWAYADLLSSITYQTACVQRARDLLHDAFVCYVVSNNPSKEQAPNAYLRGIVSHLLVNEYRHYSKFVVFDALLHAQEHAFSPERLADVKQRLIYLQTIIDHLPPRCKEVFWLFHVESLSHKDIATKLGVSINMVERHLIRAMLDLRTARQHLLP